MIHSLVNHKVRALARTIAGVARTTRELIAVNRSVFRFDQQTQVFAVHMAIARCPTRVSVTWAMLELIAPLHYASRSMPQINMFVPPMDSAHHRTLVFVKMVTSVNSVKLQCVSKWMPPIQVHVAAMDNVPPLTHVSAMWDTLDTTAM